MIEGYVINNAGRSKYIFKQHVGPGSRIPLKEMYRKYQYKYKGEFDVDFLNWLEENKVPDDFDIVVEHIEESVTEEVQEEDVDKIKALPSNSFDYDKITHTEIADLKMKDNPKKVIALVDSVHKLRRALTICNNRKGKSTLIKIIKKRIEELK